jgi:hypothetical protein
MGRAAARVVSRRKFCPEFLLLGIAVLLSSLIAFADPDGGTYKGKRLVILSNSDLLVSGDGNPNLLFKGIEKDILDEYDYYWLPIATHELTLTFIQKPTKNAERKDENEAPDPKGNIDFTISMFKQGTKIIFTNIPSPEDAPDPERFHTSFAALVQTRTVLVIRHQVILQSKEKFEMSMKEFVAQFDPFLNPEDPKHLNADDPKVDRVREFINKIEGKKGLLTRADEEFDKKSGDLFLEYLDNIAEYNKFAERFKKFGFTKFEPCSAPDQKAQKADNP